MRHDAFAKGVVLFGSERALRQEVGQIVFRIDPLDLDEPLGNKLTYLKVAPTNVPGALCTLTILGELHCPRVIHKEHNGLRHVAPHLIPISAIRARRDSKESEADDAAMISASVEDMAMHCCRRLE